MDGDRWCIRPLVKRYGVWPGGLRCALLHDPKGRRRRRVLPLEVWTPAGELLVFHGLRADRDPCRN